MIKVECVSCKAAYELDPRRIPDKGMKMRCPKCGTSFMVNKQGAASAVAAATTSQGALPNAAPPAPLAAPPLGIAPPFAPIAPKVAAPTKLGPAHAPAIVPPPAAPLPFGPGSPVSKGTMLGQPGPAAAKPAVPAPAGAPVTRLRTAAEAAPAPPRPAPAAPERPPTGSLAPPPATGPGSPVMPGLAPPFVPAAASAGSRSAAAKGAFGATMLGTSPIRAQLAESDGVDLPALRSDRTPASSVEVPEDLPALKPSRDIQDLSVSRIYVDKLPDPKGEVDLPAPRASGPVQGAKPAARFDAGDVDLPAPKQPAAAPAKATGGSGYGDLDLPTLKSHGAAPVAPQPGRALKPDARELKPPAGVPKLGSGGFGDIDLPTLSSGADLPTLRSSGADLPTPKLTGADLPMLRNAAADLPTPKNMRADLPAPKNMGADLPALRGAADLPMPRSEVDLPSRAGRAFGDLDLPVPVAEVGFGNLDLPAAKNDLPVPKRDEESSFADLELELPDLPPSESGPPGYPQKDASGHIQLPPPRPAADLVPPKAKTVQGMGARGPVPQSESLGGDSDLPPSLMGEDESSFSDLDLTEEDPAPRPPVPRPPAAPRLGARGAVSDEIEELEPDAELEDGLGGEEAYEGDDFGEAEFQEGEEGEGEEEAEGGEDMEFGISGEAAERAGSLPPEVLRRQRGEDFEAKQAARGQRTLTNFLRVAILLVVAGAAGAALTFTEYGVFGVYFWERWLPEAGDPQFARSAIEKAEKIAATDNYVDVKRSLKELGEARGKAGLNRELLTRSLLHQSLFIVRFGDDPNTAAHLAAIMKRLEERAFKAPGMDLARAADAARRKQWHDVEAPLERARAQAGSDPYVELLAGEMALVDGKLDAAEKAFGKALQLGGGTRAQWGLARIALRRSDVEAQTAAVNETLKLSPMHVEARTAEARIVWIQGKEDRALHLLRVALGLEPTEEDQFLWSSKQAVASGYSLLGYIHETRGRLHPAREAYEQALSGDPYRVEALLGSGRVLLREKRYSDAQARFESALSSATKGSENPTLLSGRKADIEAKLGIARSLLALERAQEAKGKLEELNAVLPNDPDIILALGEAAQSLGNPDQAESQFRKSIELAPKRFDGYLALAQLFFKKGNAGKASEILNEAASQVEETAEMRRMLGQSELARSRLDSAIHEFSRALELDPHDVDAMFGMALALRKHGDLDQAERQLAEIGKRDPGYAGLAEQSGLLFEARGDFKKAAEAYGTALEKDKGDSSLLLRLGAAQVSAGDFDTAEQTLAKVIRELPNSAETEYFIGRIAFARGRTPDALTHFDRAVSLDGLKGEYHLYVGRASLEMGNLGRTLEEIQAAINFDPSLGDAYWVRAMVRLRMGAVKDSLKDLSKTLALNPARTEAYAVQGDCYEQLRQMPEAIHAYRTAIEKNPARGEWHYRLAMLEADTGNRAEADAAVKKSLELGDKMDPMPYWLPDAYRLAGENAEMRDDRTTAIRDYKRYITIASLAAIDHVQILKKLKAWGVQLDEEQ